MPLALTSLEIKLLALAMDAGAAPGEISAGAAKFIESLRNRGITANDIVVNLNTKSLAPKYTRPDYGLIPCPFKKHKDELARDIEPSYLRFMIQWVREHKVKEVRTRYAQWADDMEAFLAQ